MPCGKAANFKESLFENVILSGNLCNCSLEEVTPSTLFHIAGNKIGEIGVEAFLISIQRQGEVSSSGKPTGLMRLSVSVSYSAEHNLYRNLFLYYPPFGSRDTKCMHFPPCGFWHRLIYACSYLILVLSSSTLNIAIAVDDYLAINNANYTMANIMARSNSNQCWVRENMRLVKTCVRRYARENM